MRREGSTLENKTLPEPHTLHIHTAGHLGGAELREWSKDVRWSCCIAKATFRMEVFNYVVAGHTEEENRLLATCTATGCKVEDTDCNKGNAKENSGKKTPHFLWEFLNIRRGSTDSPFSFGNIQN